MDSGASLLSYFGSGGSEGGSSDTAGAVGGGVGFGSVSTGRLMSPSSIASGLELGSWMNFKNSSGELSNRFRILDGNSSN